MRDKVKQLRNSDGFTIIEVLIVLVIAAAIMLLVFLAVPALQRNSRNTQRKQDASAILSAVSEFTSNNNGNLPTSMTPVLSIVPQDKRAYYKNDTNLSLSTSATSTSKVDKMIVVTGKKCGQTTNADGSVTQGAVDGNARSIIVLYATESTGGGTDGIPQCVESGV